MKLLTLILPQALLLASSHAVIVWSGIQDIAIPSGSGLSGPHIDGVFIDIDNPGVSTVTTLSATTNEVNFTLGGTGLFSGGGFLPIRTDATATGEVAKLLPGTSVTITDTTGPVGLGAHQEVFNENPADFTIGEDAYIGFLFTPDGAATQHAGWMRVTLTNNTADGVVHEWAYQSEPNTAIVVGAVPEPSTLLLGSLGLTAVLRRRRS